MGVGQSWACLNCWANLAYLGCWIGLARHGRRFNPTDLGRRPDMSWPVFVDNPGPHGRLSDLARIACQPNLACVGH